MTLMEVKLPSSSLQSSAVSDDLLEAMIAIFIVIGVV
jgi:hypothetical protein